MQDSLKKLPGVGIYVIDVGVADPVDFSLGEPRLSAEVLSNRSPLTIQTELACLGPSDQRTVELYLIDADGKPQQRSAESVTVAPGEAQQIEFSLASLGLGPRIKAICRSSGKTPWPPTTSVFSPSR